MPESTHPHRADAAAQETLAALNSHLGRFLQHADELLDECRGFGESVRASVERQFGQLDNALDRAIAEAGQRAMTQFDSQVERAVDRALGPTLEQALGQTIVGSIAAAVDQKLGQTLGPALGRAAEHALGERLSALRREVEALTQLLHQTGTALPAAGGPGGPGGLDGLGGPGPRARPAVPEPALSSSALSSSFGPWRGADWRTVPGILLISANAMLAVLVVVGLAILVDRDSPDRPDSGPGTGQAGLGMALSNSTAAPTASGSSMPDESAVPALCATLAGGYQATSAQAFVAAAAAAWCGDRAGPVTAALSTGLAAAASHGPDRDPTSGAADPADHKSPSQSAPKGGSKGGQSSAARGNKPASKAAAKTTKETTKKQTTATSKKPAPKAAAKPTKKSAPKAAGKKPNPNRDKTPPSKRKQQ